MDVFSRIEGQNFVWDSEKAASNIVKHGVSLSVAALVFFDDLILLEDASREGEARMAAIGAAGKQDLLYVVHLERDSGVTRIISARNATRRERKIYVDQG